MLNTGNFIKQILNFRNLDQATLAEKCGYGNQSCVSGLITRGNMRVDNLYKLLDAMDCEIVIKDKNSRQEWIIMDN